jgi:hypothetical protein
VGLCVFAIFLAVAQEPTREETINFLKSKLEGTKVLSHFINATRGCANAPYRGVSHYFNYQSLEVDACEFNLTYKLIIQYPDRDDGESTKSLVLSLGDMSLDSIKVSDETANPLVLRSPRVSLSVGKRAVDIYKVHAC